MLVYKFSTFLVGISSLLGLGSLAITYPSHALTVIGDATTTQGGAIFLSNNANQNEDSSLGNTIGNAYNLSGDPAIPAFDLEMSLGLPDGTLSPDIPNFVEAIEGSAALKTRITIPENYKFGWTFLTNDETFTEDGVDFDDYAFLMLRDSNTQEIEIVRLASTNSNETLLVPSSTEGSVIDLPFLREATGTNIIEAGTYDIAFGVVDVQDGDKTSALAVWLPDFGDAPDSYSTLRESDGPVYLESEFQRLGTFKDDEVNGQPTTEADGDDRNLLDGFVPRVDDEDGVEFGLNWVDVTFNITRPDANEYQLRAWWDTNYNGIFDHLSELYIDDLLTLEPSIFTKRYDLGFNPKADGLYSRFRLTLDPLDPDVKPFGEYYSKIDCNANDAAAGNCVSHGEVEDYVHVPEPSSIFGLIALGTLSAALKRKQNKHNR